MIGGRVVAMLAVIILASLAVQAVLHALVPLIPLFVLVGVAVAVTVGISRYRDRW